MPSWCSNGCPFYGTPQTNNLCSACYRLAQAAAPASSTSGSTAAMTASAPPPPPMHPAPLATPVMPPVSSSSSSSTPSSLSTISTPSLSIPEPTVSHSESTSSVAICDKAPDPVSTTRPTNRCFTCRKKLGLTPFVCRCSRAFCAAHLQSEAHACEFDYKAHHRQALARANPTVVAKKLDKI